MEWVEVRGDTLAAAEEEALDQLGVARDDAEFEVVQEPENRWMGLKKTEARVRARVKPTQARAKADGGRNNRRSRGKRGKPAGNGRGGRDAQAGSQAKQGGGSGSRGKGGGAKKPNQRSGSGGGGKGRARDDRQKSSKSGQAAQGAGNRSGPAQGRPNDSQTKKEAAVNDSDASAGPMPVEEQQKTVTDFLEGVVSGFGLDGAVSARDDDGTIIASIDGPGLGLLIGPRGGTLQAIQELSRSALQRSSDGRDTSRLRIDVGGYREQRRAALVEFAQRQADEVKESGANVALEPMSSLDRKTIHDAVMEIAGVKSTSEGDDPYRRVVLLPEG